MDSGLEEVATGGVTLGQAEAEILDLLVEADVAPGQAPLCGFSVHFDRAFLARYLPLIDQWLHYRHVDISTLHTLTKLWWPDGAVERAESPHRAGPDVAAAIEAAHRYRRLLWPTRWPEPEAER